MTKFIILIFSTLIWATDLDDEILNDFDFAMSLGIIQESPQDDFNSWNDLETVAIEDKIEENTKRSQK
ncbi:MAG: hypothetical protein Fur0010_16600 [Bdellovibrio sp.]